MNRNMIHHIVTILGSLPALAIVAGTAVVEPQLLNPWFPRKMFSFWEVLVPVGIGGIVCLVNGVVGLICEFADRET